MQKLIIGLLSVGGLLCSNSAFANNLKDIHTESASAQAASPWTFNVGGAGLYLPEYEGADDSEGIAVPYFSAKYKDKLRLNIFTGLDYDVVSSGPFTLGVGLGIDFGRKEDKSDRLEGLGDIDAALEPKIYLAYQQGKLTTKVTLASDAGGDGHDGSTVDFNVRYFVPLSRGSFLMPSLGATYGDDQYMQSYFGVSQEQSQSSAAGLAEHEAKSGLKSVSLSMLYVTHISGQWSFMGIAQLKSILGDAEDSPLVKETSQPLLGGIVTYQF